MKKLSKGYKKWLLYRSQRQFRQRRRYSRYRQRPSRHIVRAWSGEAIQRVISTRPPYKPPPIICFRENTVATLAFFDRWREDFAIRRHRDNVQRYKWLSPPNRSGRLPRIRGYIDFSEISNIATAPALVMAAEYDRAAQLIGSTPPTINLDEWNRDVLSKLFQLGFFDILGITDNVRELYHDDGAVRTMRIVRGTNTSDLQRTSERLISLSNFLDADGPMTEEVVLALNSALSEAMANVARHAYPPEFDFRFTHVNAWWVTASADRTNRRLTVVVYDQGASIPVTIPQKPWMHSVQQYILQNLLVEKQFEYQDDATYIEGAMRHGRTQTQERGRGEGLPQMKELVDICGGGSLTIWSRGGVCQYTPDAELAKATYEFSVGGTLIEWVMDLPRG